MFFIQIESFDFLDKSFNFSDLLDVFVLIRLGSNNNNNAMLLSNNIISIESISPTRSFQIPMSKMSCCSRCLQSYENDVAKVEKDLTGDNRSVLPQWLQNAKANDDGDKKLVSDLTN